MPDARDGGGGCDGCDTGDPVTVLHRPDHDVTVGLVFEIALRDRSRLAELDAARAEMNPELLSWLYRAA